jgi:hypothetical protein
MEAPSTDILERLAASLAEIAGAPSLAAAVPERERRAALLRVARDIAHASERQNAPLATYLAGRYVERRRQAGVDEGHALEEVARLVGQLINGESD